MLRFSRWQIWTIIALCVGSILYAVPNVLPQWVRDQTPSWLPKNTVSLGLDLQGGASLLLGVDLPAVFKEKMESTLDEIRQRLRKANILYTGLSIKDETVQVRIRDAAQLEQARATLGELVQPVDGGLLGGGSNSYELQAGPEGLFTFVLTEPARVHYRQQAMQQSIEIVRRRIDELGTREPTIVQQGPDRILVQVPGLSDPQRLKNILGKTAKLQFRFVDTTVPVQDAVAGRVPPGSELLYEIAGEQRIPYVIEKRVIVSGDQLVNAQQSFDQYGQAVVSFTFDAQGARRFGDATKDNVGRNFAIVLDNTVVSAPVIREPILNGSGQISGSFSVQTANDLAIVLRAGALPAPLNILEERTVGAELGADSIQAGALAAISGFVLVVLFILVFYGLFGLFANLALVINVIMILSVMTLLGSTLTLPGIAGIVLTIGMAVDANVLIFERMREEVAAGKGLISAIDTGYNRAMSAIIDANLTTLLAVLILFWLGSGPVRGFAVTLGIGITVSMFTAIMVTRLMVVGWLRTFKPKALPI